MKKITLVIILSMFLSSAVNAAVIDEVFVNSSTGVIEISGKNETGNKENFLNVFHPGKTIGDYNGNNGAEVFVQIKQAVSNENGIFEFEFNLSDAVGDSYDKNNNLYAVTVTAAGETSVDKTFYWYKDVTPIYEGMTSEMGQTTENTQAVKEINKIIDDNPDAFAIDFKLYDDIKAAGKAENIAKIMSMHSTPADFEALKEVFVAATVLETINNSSSEDEILNLINSYATELEMSDYTAFAELKEKSIDAAGILKDNAPYETIDKFNTNVKIAVALVEMKNAGGTSAVEKVLRKYNTLFELTEYDDNDTNKTATCKNILNAIQSNTIKEIADIQDILNRPVQKTDGGNSGGGSSSGGGNRGGGVSMSSDYMSRTEYNQNNLVEPVGKNGFTDIDNVEWAKEAIEELTKLKIVNGVSATSFEPENYVTRAQFCKMVSGCFGIKTQNKDTKFSDVTKDDWYNGYVSALYELGVINGMSDTYFGADEYISREDIAVIIYRISSTTKLELKADDEKRFIDSENISDYAKEMVSALANSKILNGYDDNSFKPQENATRAETANLIYKVYKLLQEVGA